MDRAEVVDRGKIQSEPICNINMFLPLNVCIYHYCILCLDVVSDVTRRMLSAEYIPLAWLLANVWEAPHSDPVHSV